MELPPRPFPLSRLKNCLSRSAIHPKLGLAWTDGHSIFLIPLNQKYAEFHELISDDGKFPAAADKVIALFWNASTGNANASLCVFTDKSVVILSVRIRDAVSSIDSASTPFSNIPVAAFPTFPFLLDALWNPKYVDVLCLLAKDKCLILTKVGKAECKFCTPQIPSSASITCGTWSPDGLTLFLGIGSSIQTWSWVDHEAMLNENSQARRKSIEVSRASGSASASGSGDVLSMAFLDDDNLVLTTSVPNLLPGGDFREKDWLSSSSSLSSSNDNDQIISLKRQPEKPHPLFDIHGRERDEEGELRKQVAKSLASLAVLSKTDGVWNWRGDRNIPGILSPDLLAVHPAPAEASTDDKSDDKSDVSWQVVVGSYSADRLLRYRVNAKTMAYEDDLVLPPGCRVRGLATSENILDGKAPSHFLAAMTTTSSSSSFSHTTNASTKFDNAFLPPPTTTKSFPVSLHFLDFEASKQGSVETSDASNTQQNQRYHHQQPSRQQSPCQQQSRRKQSQQQQSKHQSHQQQSQQQSHQQQSEQQSQKQQSKQQSHQQQSPRTDSKGDDAALRDLVRDCVFALRAADPEQVKDGSAATLKDCGGGGDDVWAHQMSVANVNGNPSKVANDGPSIFDLLNDLGEAFDQGTEPRKDNDNEKSETLTSIGNNHNDASRSVVDHDLRMRTSISNQGQSTSTLSAGELKGRLSTALDTPRNGPIDLTVLLGGSGGNALSEVEGRGSTDLQVQRRGPIDLTALLGGSVETDVLKVQGQSTSSGESCIFRANNNPIDLQALSVNQDRIRGASGFGGGSFDLTAVLESMKDREMALSNSFEKYSGHVDLSALLAGGKGKKVSFCEDREDALKANGRADLGSFDLTSALESGGGKKVLFCEDQENVSASKNLDDEQEKFGGGSIDLTALLESINDREMALSNSFEKNLGHVDLSGYLAGGKGKKVSFCEDREDELKVNGRADLESFDLTSALESCEDQENVSASKNLDEQEKFSSFLAEVKGNKEREGRTAVSALEEQERVGGSVYRFDLNVTGETETMDDPDFKRRGLFELPAVASKGRRREGKVGKTRGNKVKEKDGKDSSSDEEVDASLPLRRACPDKQDETELFSSHSLSKFPYLEERRAIQKKQNGLSAATTSSSSSSTSSNSKLSSLETRLERIENKLIDRLKRNREKDASTNVELLEMRIERIERLVEMVCLD